jgi:hypothetical protein
MAENQITPGGKACPTIHDDHHWLRDYTTALDEVGDYKAPTRAMDEFSRSSRSLGLWPLGLAELGDPNTMF